jgi:hypothetical protein
VRVFLIEATAAGMITPIENSIDEAGFFVKGKLLSRYALTNFGYSRLQMMGMLDASDSTEAAG